MLGVWPSTMTLTLLVLSDLALQPMALRARSADEDWFHPAGHRVHALFSRQATNGTTNETEVFPTVGSLAWKALFPPSRVALTSTSAKQAWLAALNDAKGQGLVPANVPIPVYDPKSGNPTYPNGTDPKGSLVCSATYFCRGTDDVWDAPAGHVGIAFDDGPLPTSSPLLYSFLRAHNQTATHFFIGSNIYDHPDIFLEAYEQNGDDIACHTYTHPYMTTLADEVVVAEFGWQLEIVRVSTGGRIPRYWRPPYGDVDNRIRAIATHVFGLTTVVWSHDSLDWELPDGPVTSAGVHQNYTKWYSGPKSPGINILSHELTTYSVQARMDTYPLIASNGWTSQSIPDLFGGGWYVNARNDSTPVVAGVQVAQGGGTPVWSGFAQESASLGSTTRLTFTSTVVDGSTVPITAFSTATATPSVTAVGQHSGAVGGLVKRSLLGHGLRWWTLLLGVHFAVNGLL